MLYKEIFCEKERRVMSNRERFVVAGAAAASAAMPLTLVLAGFFLLGAFFRAITLPAPEEKRAGAAPRTVASQAAPASSSGPAPARAPSVVVRDVTSSRGRPDLDAGPGLSASVGDDYLIVKFTVSNDNDTKVVRLKGWGEDHPELLVARVEDEHGNKYRPVIFGAFARPKGSLRGEVNVLPGEAVADLVVFDRPARTARKLTLVLPADHYGQGGEVRLTLSP